MGIKGGGEEGKRCSRWGEGLKGRRERRNEGKRGRRRAQKPESRLEKL